MSRIAKNEIKINSEISCFFENGIFRAKGKLGEMEINIKPNISVIIKDSSVSVVPKDDNSKKDPNWGTTRSIVANIIRGVSEGFTKTLELNGTGYRASITGSKLKLQLGFSHDIDFDIPDDLKITVEKQTIIKISGSDKQLVGMTASKIKSIRPPEPYKGKGIKEKGQYILRKEGKKK